jgi:hypothetical protein
MVTIAATITAETAVVLVSNETMIMSGLKVVITVCRSSHKVPACYLSLIVTKSEFSRHNFVEVLYTIFNVNLSSGSQVLPH